LNHSFKFR